MSDSESRGVSLHTKILAGLILGAAAGVVVNQWFVQGGSAPPWLENLLKYVLEPVGQIFLRMLIMTVIPLVFASLAVGVARLGDLRSLGRVGAKTFAYFVITMSLAVTIGLVLVNSLQPGAGLPAEVRDELLAKYRDDAAAKLSKGEPFGISTFVNIIPRNPLQAAVQMDMLGVIFFALLVGVGLTIIDRERANVMLTVLDGLSDLMVVIINLAMRLAPYGVFALIFAVTAKFGFHLLKSLGLYVVIVLVGIAVQMFGVLSVLIAVLSRLSPLVFFRKVSNIMATAFSTSSSNATLPTTIKTAEEELGIPPKIAGFVLPLGATMNMNGTALFEGVTAVFLAQVFGVELALSDQIVIVILSVLTAIGAAGVPGGSIPLLGMVVASGTQNRVSPEAIALILGVDRILDMCRTTLNVIGDVAAATYVTRSEGYALKTD